MKLEDINHLVPIGYIFGPTLPGTPVPDGWLALEGVKEYVDEYPELAALLDSYVFGTDMFKLPYVEGCWIKAR